MVLIKDDGEWRESATGRVVRKPIMKEILVAKRTSTLSRRTILARTAVPVVTNTEAKISKFPSKPPNPSWNLRTGPIIVISVPARATSIPILSLFVTRSLRKKMPAVIIVIGAIAEIRFELIEVVFSVPRNKSPKETVEIRNPFSKVRPKTWDF